MDGTVTEGWLRRWTELWFRRLTEGSALGGRVQVPGRGVWLTGRDIGTQDLDGSPGPYIKGLKTPLRFSPLFRLHAFARSFLSAHPGRYSLSATFLCCSAYGKGWEEFRLGPGGLRDSDAHESSILAENFFASKPPRSTRALLPPPIFRCATVFYATRRHSLLLARGPHSPTTLDSPRARLAHSCASLLRVNCRDLACRRIQPSPLTPRPGLEANHTMRFSLMARLVLRCFLSLCYS
jgi:hypothetical protein